VSAEDEPGHGVVDVDPSHVRASPAVDAGQPRVQARAEEGDQEGEKQKEECFLAAVVDVRLVAWNGAEEIHFSPSLARP